jgi:hypothetical protein
MNPNAYVNKNRKLYFGILFIIIGLLWFAQNAGLFPSNFFGPLVMVMVGIWFIVIYFVNRTVNSYNEWIKCLDLQHNNYFGL